MKEYNKLVRDKIPEIMIKNGAKPVCRTLTDEEYISELNKKLLEEVNEYLESNETEELADIGEVLLAIMEFNNINLEDMENIRKSKSEKRGAFKDRVFLIREE